MTLRLLFLCVPLLMLLVFNSCRNKNKVVAESSFATNDTPQAGDSVVVVPPANPDAPQRADTLVYYQRTMCFGSCPSFIFIAKSDGRCYYEGQNFVDLIGEYQGICEQELIQPILDLAAAMRYDTLQSVYDNPMVTDLPSVITEIEGKRVINRYGGPRLKSLYSAIDEVIARINWERLENKQ